MDCDYKAMIFELLSRINRADVLKRIYNFVARLYVNCTE